MSLNEEESPAQQLTDILAAFWQTQVTEIESGVLDFKFHTLPLARIKRVMKSDEDIKKLMKKMISSDAPLIFSKACEIFILELTIRAWMNTEESKRRTLQRADVISALSRSDMYDFLIDVVPRDGMNLYTKTSENYYPHAHAQAAANAVPNQSQLSKNQAILNYAGVGTNGTSNNVPIPSQQQKNSDNSQTPGSSFYFKMPISAIPGEESPIINAKSPKKN